nr:uncharacterized protein LOC124813918 [Hydra vulgaris]
MLNQVGVLTLKSVLRQLLLEKLKSIDGDNFEQLFRNILTNLKKLFSVELRSKMNLKENDRKSSLEVKISFDKLEYSSAIYVAVMAKWSNADHRSIQKIVGNKLKNAPAELKLSPKYN